uniref:Complement factor B n=1 Tax=Naja naja TaxID=35670 RepID=A0A8C6VJ57_NAJNA
MGSCLSELPGLNFDLHFHHSATLSTFHSASFLGTVDGDCDPKAAEILGGNYTVLEDGTTLAYDCAQGQYPYPTQFRFCENGNQWSDLKDREDRTVNQAECRAVRCVRPVQFENGELEAFQQFYEINQELKYTCYGGYQLLGPQMRTCLPTGKWSGETAICDDGTGDCRNPGIPIGAQKYGTAYQVGGTVRYQCSRGLSLIGSKERVCQESGIWSGSEPECRSPFQLCYSGVFFSSPLSGAPANNKSDSLNIYFVIDASKSFGRKRLIKAKEALLKLIQKISSYDIRPSYGIVTFATESRMVLHTTHPQSSDADWVSERLGSISIDGEHAGCKKKKCKYSNYNLGGFPSMIIQEMKEFLNTGRSSKNPPDDHLDVYVFGNGHDVNTEVINELASHKPSERHSFILKDLDELKEVLEKSLGNLNFEPQEEICKGVIVSDQDILTAAHCLAGVNGIENISVILGKPNSHEAEIQRHPQYNSQKVKNKGTPEFYDYDVALIKLKEKRLPSFARPVCLPCTIETTQILRKPHPQTTCKDHGERNLSVQFSVGTTNIFSIPTSPHPNTFLKIACNLDAKKAKRYENVTNISEVVREHFLCTGGIDPNTDPNVCSCKENWKYRNFQSSNWSVVDACTFNRSLLCNSEPTKILPSYARDFHINIFKILPWLKQHLGTKVKFL